MNCIITQTLLWAAGKKKAASPEVVARYLKLRYHIRMDLPTLRQRLNALTQPDQSTVQAL